MPPESTLDMPVQSFKRYDTSPNAAAWAVPESRLARPGCRGCSSSGAGFALTVYGAMEMYRVIDVGAITPLKWALLVLFVANFSWIAIAFTGGLLGFFWLLFKRAATVPGLPRTL